MNDQNDKTPDPPLLEYLGTVNGVQRFRTTRDIEAFGFLVPAGYPTDLASIPWCLRWLCPKFGPWDWATILHDCLCEYKLCSRFMADAIFREDMAKYGVPRWRRIMMYYGVRAWAVLTGKK